MRNGGGVARGRASRRVSDAAASRGGASRGCLVGKARPLVLRQPWFGISLALSLGEHVEARVPCHIGRPQIQVLSKSARNSGTFRRNKETDAATEQADYLRPGKGPSIAVELHTRRRSLGTRSSSQRCSGELLARVMAQGCRAEGCRPTRTCAGVEVASRLPPGRDGIHRVEPRVPPMRNRPFRLVRGP